jgi:superoxide dismutase, Fe-Mn family
MYTLPPLPYDHNALEPHIDAATMQLHHDKHHQAYIDKANAALEKAPEWKDKPVEELLKNIDQVPESVRQALINNGGGHANHSLFWQIMTPGGSHISAVLLEKINQNFGGLESFIDKFNEVAKTRFGSGWAWLVVNSDNSLEVISTPNQDSPLMHNQTPILGLDVWEHAYYLNYQNKRPDYIQAWWNVVNWAQVEDNYQQAVS